MNTSKQNQKLTWPIRNFQWWFRCLIHYHFHFSVLLFNYLFLSGLWYPHRLQWRFQGKDYRLGYNMTIIFYISRCKWQREDLLRFICLKIWPRLPNQSKRAIKVLHDSADSNDERTYSSELTLLYARPVPSRQRSDDNVFNQRSDI